MNKNQALQRHYLSAILPFPTHSPVVQFKKTKDFYKPDKCIWNNPHRTSKPMYKFFHSYNDQFTEKMEPKIQEMEREDREKQEKERIERLRSSRQQTRKRLTHRKQERERLQCMSNSRRNYSYGSIKSEVTKNEMKKKRSKKKFIFVGNPEIQKTYDKGVEQFDKNVSKVQKLMADQFKTSHDTIRSQFIKKKKENDIGRSRILNKTSNILS